MSPRAEYYKLRRQKLRRQKRCIRCGMAPARSGHVTCAACAAVMSIKDELRRNASARRRLRCQRQRARLEAIYADLQRRLAQFPV